MAGEPLDSTERAECSADTVTQGCLDTRRALSSGKIQMKKKRLLPRTEDKRRSVTSVGQLEDLLVRKDCAHAVSEHDGKKLLDLQVLGFTKLLGSGKVRVPVLVKIGSFSRSAAAKLEAAGGRIEKTAT